MIDTEETPTTTAPVVTAERPPAPTPPAAALAPGVDLGPTLGSSPQAPDDRRRRSPIVLLLLAILVALVVIAALLAVRGSGHSSVAASAGSVAHATRVRSHGPTTLAPGATASPTVSLIAPVTTVPGPASGPAPTTVAPPPTVTPTTVSTTVGFGSAGASPAQVACPTTTSYPTVHLTWSALNASSVDLSVDGPGVYVAGLAATGSYDFGYGCSGPHTLTLTAHGAGGTTATRTFVITSHT